MTTYRLPQPGEKWRYRYRLEADDMLDILHPHGIYTDMSMFDGREVRIVRPNPKNYGPDWFEIKFLPEGDGFRGYVAAAWELEPLSEALR